MTKTRIRIEPLMVDETSCSLFDCEAQIVNTMRAGDNIINSLPELLNLKPSLLQINLAEIIDRETNTTALLEALEDLLETRSLVGCDAWVRAGQKARAAISHAEGKEQ